MRLLTRKSRPDPAPARDFSSQVEDLLDRAQEALNTGRPQVAVTHLAHAVYAGQVHKQRVTELELYRKVKRIIDSGGELP